MSCDVAHTFDQLQPVLRVPIPRLERGRIDVRHFVQSGQGNVGSGTGHGTGRRMREN
jgi:hypothetical protein